MHVHHAMSKAAEYWVRATLFLCAATFRRTWRSVVRRIRQTAGASSAIDPSTCRCSLDKCMSNGLLPGISGDQPLLPAYQITSLIRIKNTSSYFRIGVLSEDECGSSEILPTVSRWRSSEDIDRRLATALHFCR